VQFDTCFSSSIQARDAARAAERLARIRSACMSAATLAASELEVEGEPKLDVSSSELDMEGEPKLDVGPKKEEGPNVVSGEDRSAEPAKRHKSGSSSQA